MSDNLADRAKRLSEVRVRRDEATLALGLSSRFERPQENSFLQGWLHPQHDPGQWVARVDSGGAGSMTSSEANDRVLRELGREIYEKIAATTRALGKQPYQYGEIGPWVEEEHRALLQPMRSALAGIGRKLLDETLRRRRKAERDFVTFYQDLAMIGVQQQFVQNASLYLTLRQSCPIILVDGLGQRLAGGSQSLPETQFLQRDEWKQLSWWKECNMPPPPGPPHWSEQPWSRNNRPSVMFQQAQQLVLERLGVRTAAEGRLRLLAELPILGFLDRMFSVSGLVSVLLEPPEIQLKSLQRALVDVQRRISASNDSFDNEVRNITSTQWARYGPLIRFLAETLIAEGYDSRLVEAAQDLLIAPARKPGWSDHLALVFTVAALALAFFPPLTAVALGAAVLGAGLGVGVKIKEYHNGVGENEARRHLSYGQVAAIDALQIIEDPTRTNLAEQALLIELIFAVSTVLPVAKSASNLIRPPRVASTARTPRPTATQRQVAAVTEEREQLLGRHGRVSKAADRAASEVEDITAVKRMVDRDRSLASGDDVQRGVSSTEPRTPASRAITDEQRGLANARSARDNLIAQRDHAEQEVRALTDLSHSASNIIKLGDTVPTTREYRRLLEKRTNIMEHLRHLDPDDVRHRRALEVSVFQTSEKIRTYETLRQARLRLPAMRRDDADQLIMIMRHRDIVRSRVQKLDQQIRQLQETIETTQKNLSRLNEELTILSGNLETIRGGREKVLAELTHQRDALELQIRQKAEEVRGLRLLEADAARRAAYINKLAGGAAFLEELAKRGLDTGFGGGEMAPEVELYLPAWAH